MQLEVGKYYKTRDGRKVGPIRSYKDYDGQYHWDDSEDSFDINGINLSGECPEEDLIAEWTDEPAQLTAIDHLRKACELFLVVGNDKAAFDVLGVVLDHE